MRWSLVLVVLSWACSSAPGPERSAQPDGNAGDAPLPEPTPSEAAPVANAPAADDVTDEELAALRQRGGCPAAGAPAPSAHAVWCDVLARFAGGSAPTWRPGSYPGVVVDASGEGAELARPALLAVRQQDGRAQVSWAAASPDDPAQAAAMAAMAADVLAGRSPTLTVAQGQGVTWAAPVATRGASASVSREPRTLARQKDGTLLVIAWMGDVPMMALHRAQAVAP